MRERTVGKDGKRTIYTHRRLRSAYLSFKRNIPWLWTYQDYPNLHIPNTNNAIEGVFTDIKTKLRVHFRYNERQENRSDSGIYCKTLLTNILPFAY